MGSAPPYAASFNEIHISFLFSIGKHMVHRQSKKQQQNQKEN